MKAIGGIIAVIGIGIGVWYQTGTTNALKDLGTISERACACKDVACAEKVMEDFNAWVDANQERVGSEREANAVQGLAQATQACLQNVDTAIAAAE